MGKITIEFQGSFGNDKQEFSAMDHGHAHCVNEAMEYLTTKMQEAINGDHKLPDDNVGPAMSFIKPSGSK